MTPLVMLRFNLLVLVLLDLPQVAIQVAMAVVLEEVCPLSDTCCFFLHSFFPLARPFEATRTESAQLPTRQTIALHYPTCCLL